MKLGLIGTGKQGQRYLLEKNGGRHIVRSGSRDLDDWEGLDGVIIATHPAGHKQLALKAIERGLPVLVEKPLALTLADCEAIIDAAEARGVKLQVAHTHLWSKGWLYTYRGGAPVAVIRYMRHERDYSPWLDWAPHGLALVAAAEPNMSPDWLAASVAVSKDSGLANLVVLGDVWHYTPDRQLDDTCPPMLRMIREFVAGETKDYRNTRRIYRALFSE